MNFTDKISKLGKTRTGFFVVLVGFSLVALIFGAFTWTQIDLLRENLRWGQNYGRAISYGVKIGIFGLATFISAACPVTFLVLLIRKKLRQLTSSSQANATNARPDAPKRPQS